MAEQANNTEVQWKQWESDLTDLRKVMPTSEAILGRRIDAREYFSNPDFEMLMLPGLSGEDKLAILLLKATAEQMSPNTEVVAS